MFALLWASPALSQSTWRLTPTLGGEVAWTSNVDLVSRDLQQSDLVFIVTPGLTVDYEAPRALLRGYVNLPTRLYARTGADNNEVSPQADLFGRLVVVDRFLFVEGQASITQTYSNPFGPRPPDLINATDNRYTSQVYRVTPYIEGSLTNSVRYQLRNDNIWSTLNDYATFNGQSLGTERSYFNHLYGFVEREPGPFGGRVAIDRKQYWFEDQERDQILELLRAIGAYRPNPQWEVFVTGGYERNRFPLSSYDGAIYGGGFRWRPSERTKLDAAAEHRFFGTSYLVLFDHRSPTTVWNLSAKRDVTSYPEAIGSLPAGTSVSGALDTILQSRIPDPTERAQFVENFIAERGLPSTLVEPLTLYSQLLYLQESLGGSVGLLGVRNAVFLNAYRNKTQAISGAGNLLPPVIGSQDNNVQIGVGLVWSYALSGTASLTASGTYTQTESLPPFEALSDQYEARVVLSRRIGARTSGYVGARFQIFNSDVEPDYRETAVFVGLNYSFR